VSSLTTGEILVYYSPDPRLEYPEKFIPTSSTLYSRNFNTFLEKQYEKPRDKPFILSIIGANNINKNSREALFMLRLSTSDVYGQDYRMPLNVSFLLDKSGSMYCCERSESLKKSLWDIGNSLTDEDVVSVVLFDNDAVTVQHSFASHLDGFERIIENYNPSGGTNIYKGLQEGVRNINKDFDSDKSNRIILLTDGYGTSQPKDIINFVEQMSSKGVEFSTIGLGDGFNQSLLELISIKGNGTFNYVDNSVELSDVFLEEVKKSFNYKVKNLKIEVFHNENLIYSTLYGYQTDSVEKGKLSFSIGKIPSNYDYISYLKFSIDEPSPEIENEPLIIKISYFDLVENKKVSYKEVVSLNWTDETNTELLLEKEEKKLYGIAILNQSLKLMADANEANNPKAAKLYLQQAIDQINEIFPDAKPKDVKKLFDDVNKYMKLFKQIEINKY
jgi:Ca-activated chloride channel family protein